MNKVVTLPASATFTPEQALASAIDLGMQDVLIIGYDRDGIFITRSSRMSRMDAIWLLKLAERWALGESES